MSPCESCIRLTEAEQRGEIRGWLSGLKHREHCTGDEFCPCTLLYNPKEKDAVKQPEQDDTPLIDLTEKK